MTKSNVVQLDRQAGDLYPLKNTKAARMFADGLTELDRELGRSQRDVARTLGYKSSVVISHMASGRAPIPIDRATDFARVLKLDRAEFLMAVLEQRHPDIDFHKILLGRSTLKTGGSAADGFIEDLEHSANRPVSELKPEQITIMRAVAADPAAKRRWASINEMTMLDVLRKERPDLVENGFNSAQRKAFEECIAKL